MQSIRCALLAALAPRAGVALAAGGDRREARAWRSPRRGSRASTRALRPELGRRRATFKERSRG